MWGGGGEVERMKRGNTRWRIVFICVVVVTLGYKGNQGAEGAGVSRWHTAPCEGEYEVGFEDIYRHGTLSCELVQRKVKLQMSCKQIELT